MSTESIRKTEITSSNIPERSRRLAWLGPPPLFEGEDAAVYDERLARIAEAMKPEEKLILLQVRCLEPLIPASAAATSLGFLYTANSSRAVGGRRSRSHRRCWPSGPHLGERWPSRLVATAEEDRLSFRRNPHTSFAAASDCRTIAIYEYTPKTPPRDLAAAASPRRWRFLAPLRGQLVCKLRPLAFDHRSHFIRDVVDVPLNG
jgi:hypothetical protein